MSLSSDLIAQFVKVTNDTSNQKKESIAYGTIIESDEKKYVRLDGSEILTPISSTTSISDGDRVSVMIKDHSIVVTGNLTDPAASINIVDDAISQFEIVVADKVSTKELDAQIGRIDTLVSDNVTIKGQLTANSGSISKLDTDYLNVNKQLTANTAKIEELDAGKITTSYLEANYASIDNLKATNATIHNLDVDYGNFKKLTADDISAINGSIDNLKSTQITTDYLTANYATITNLSAVNTTVENLKGDYGDFKVLVANDFSAMNGSIDSLKSSQITTKYLEANYATIDLANIAAGAIKTAMIDNSAIGTAQIADGSITDAKIIGLTASKITAGRLDAGTIDVVNLNAANITVGTINGTQIASGAIDTSKLSESLNTTITTTETNALSALSKSSTAQSTADGKNTIFYQASQPTAKKENDVWFDTDDGYKMYSWNGSKWVDSQLGTNAIADAAITNAKIGNIDAGKITSGYISADRIDAESITYGKLNSTAVASINALVEVGGRNILKDTNKGKISWGYAKSDGASTVEDYEVIGVKMTCTVPATVWQMIVFTFDESQINLLVPNSEYTISFDLKTDMSANQLSVTIMQSDSTNILSGTGYANVIADNNWHKVTIKITTNNLSGLHNNQYIYIGGFNRVGSVCFKNLKLEKGNKATDWTPAPEDVQADIQTNGIGNWCYNNDLTYINGGKIYTGTITANSLAANSVTADKILGSTITGDKIAGNTITASNIASETITADKILGSTITGDKIAAKTITANNLVANTITANSGIIADAAITNAKIASVDAGKITSGYISADRIDAGSITYGKLNSEAIASINALVEVGGRNLIINNILPISNNAYLISQLHVSPSEGHTLSTGYGQLIEGKEYTITIDVTPTSDVSSIAVYLSNGWACPWDLKTDGTANRQTLTMTAKAFYCPGRTPNDDADFAALGIYRMPWQESYTTNITIHSIKLESGNKATDWTPAPEDVQADIVANGIGNWCYNNDLTYINGGKIYTGTVTANSLAANSVTADKISVTSLEAICAKIGGFDIGSTALYNGTVSLAGADDSVYVGIDGISCGTKFKVTNTGDLTTTSGMIGGFNISSVGLYNDTGTVKYGFINGKEFIFYIGSECEAASMYNSTFVNGMEAWPDIAMTRSGKLMCNNLLMRGRQILYIENDVENSISGSFSKIYTNSINTRGALIDGATITTLTLGALRGLVQTLPNGWTGCCLDEKDKIWLIWRTSEATIAINSAYGNGYYNMDYATYPWAVSSLLSGQATVYCFNGLYAASINNSTTNSINYFVWSPCDEPVRTLKTHLTCIVQKQ